MGATVHEHGIADSTVDSRPTVKPFPRTPSITLKGRKSERIWKLVNERVDLTVLCAASSIAPIGSMPPFSPYVHRKYLPLRVQPAPRANRHDPLPEAFCRNLGGGYM